MPAGTAVGDVAAAAHHVEALVKRLRAAQTGEPGGQRLALCIAVLMQQPEQLNHRLGRELQVFMPIEPQALAGPADVQLQRLAVSPAQAPGLHR
jgi:hypothetical protein